MESVVKNHLHPLDVEDLARANSLMHEKGGRAHLLWMAQRDNDDVIYQKKEQKRKKGIRYKKKHKKFDLRRR
jgi:hypothetical protein